MNAVWTDNEVAAPQAKPETKPESSAKPTSLKKRLCRQVGQAIMDFNMIEEGDA
jgi:hypothetical protein